MNLVLGPRLGLRLGAVAAFAVVAPGAALAQGFDVAGFLAGEARAFLEEPASTSQFNGVQASLAFQPEFRFRTSDRRHQFRVTPFVRVDSRDSERTHFDLREAFWRVTTGDVEVLVGMNTVFWGVAESRHLVDVINQIDFVEDVDGEDKLGQGMIQVGWQRDWGRLDGFVLLGFRQMTLPGADGRLGLPLKVVDEAYYPDGRRDVDFALRYSHYIGDFDLGVHVFRGTNREASFRVVPGERPDRMPRTQAVYREISQVGVDVQWTQNAWLWKFEGLVREGDGRTFGAAVAGVEYTLFQAFGSADLGLLTEFLVDGRDDSAAVTLFDRDIFVGTRLALNDVWDTQALAGAVVDLRDGSIAARLEVERRISNRLKLEVDGRFFVNVASTNNLALFRQDSFLNLRVAYGF
ncbi:MAG: hypothetical protein GKS06_08295 [Acidobacteria bacterium]|nr:hypothetical protein [Acidobacteriota bacterium]